jgi:hypothetical protein
MRDARKNLFVSALRFFRYFGFGFASRKTEAILFFFHFFLSIQSERKKSRQKAEKMWRGALFGLLLVWAKIVFDIGRGVGVPTTYLQQDKYMWKLLRTHRLPAATVLQLDALVGAFLTGQPYDPQNLNKMLTNAPEPVRKAAQELIAKT